MDLSQLPGRLVTGAFIAHSGWDKWRADETTAAGMHAMAAGAYPMVKDLPPARFLRLLAAGEMAVGTALLAPVVPPAVAGAALTGFSAALLGLYARTPGLRKPGSVWPTQQGTAIAKDVWMLGIGVGLLAAARNSGRRRS
jgi:uncharacterized membrane protein YphA (DoxX/SURF4 family)